MIIKSNKFDKNLNLEDNEFYSIVIENPSFYRKFYYGLKDQLENGVEYLLYTNEKDKKATLQKDAMLIDNPMFIEIDEKKFNGLVQKNIANNQSPEEKERYQELLLAINNYVSSIIYDHSLPLSFDDEMSLSSFLKAINLSIANNSDGFIENFIFQLREMSCVFGYKIFFVMNLYDSFSTEEIENVYKELSLLDIKMINISSHLNKHAISNEFVIYIDEDLAELHYFNGNIDLEE